MEIAKPDTYLSSRSRYEGKKERTSMAQRERPRPLNQQCNVPGPQVQYNVRRRWKSMVGREGTNKISSRNQCAQGGTTAALVSKRPRQQNWTRRRQGFTLGPSRLTKSGAADIAGVPAEGVNSRITTLARDRRLPPFALVKNRRPNAGAEQIRSVRAGNKVPQVCNWRHHSCASTINVANHAYRNVDLLYVHSEHHEGSCTNSGLSTWSTRKVTAGAS